MFFLHALLKANTGISNTKLRGGQVREVHRSRGTDGGGGIKLKFGQFRRDWRYAIR